MSIRNSNDLSVAVVGASGAVGREMVHVLEGSALNVANLKLFASERSAGEGIDFKGDEIIVRDLAQADLDHIDIALFSAGSEISKEYIPRFVENGTVVIDNSSHFRMDENVPLIVPEVNSDLLRIKARECADGRGMVVANPNCSTIQLVVVLKPILERAGLERVVVSTYQSVSGAGKKGMDELWEQTRGIYSQEEVAPSTFQHQIAFNCIPHIDVFLDNGYSKEEIKMINESRKILDKPDLRITTTAVRVPVFSCHGESVNIETTKALSAEEARALLVSSPGIVVEDEPKESVYPLSSKLAGTDATYVGRIRSDESLEHGLNLWIVADNLRKGAALNAVQIAEIVAEVWGEH